jgi:AcrR family transcriptional regulator
MSPTGAVYSNLSGKEALFLALADREDEFWSFGVRNARIQEEFAKRRQAVQGALAETLDRLAAALD